MTCELLAYQSQSLKINTRNHMNIKPRKRSEGGWAGSDTIGAIVIIVVVVLMCALSDGCAGGGGSGGGYYRTGGGFGGGGFGGGK